MASSNATNVGKICSTEKQKEALHDALLFLGTSAHYTSDPKRPRNSFPWDKMNQLSSNEASNLRAELAAKTQQMELERNRALAELDEVAEIRRGMELELNHLHNEHSALVETINNEMIPEVDVQEQAVKRLYTQKDNAIAAQAMRVKTMKVLLVYKYIYISFFKNHYLQVTHIDRYIYTARYA